MGLDHRKGSRSLAKRPVKAMVASSFEARIALGVFVHELVRSRVHSGLAARGARGEPAS